MKVINTKICLAMAAAALLTGCGKSNTWTVDGVIEGGEGSSLVLEASSNGHWYPLDTLTLSETGAFSFSREAAGYPDIYRLSLDGRSLYFPIDSIETVTVSAKADAFDAQYTLSGSPQAEMMMEANGKLSEAVARLGAEAVADSTLKRDLGTLLLNDPSGIVAYYIINKKIGGRDLFSPANKRDLRIIGAVANAYSERRPSDPRTAYLANLFTSNYANFIPRADKAPSDTIVASEVGVIDITLYDEEGHQRSLAEVAGQGKPVILNFTMYTAEASPAINLALNKVYEQYRGSGLEIFQVGLDEDEYKWRQSARNLPWITVYNSTHDGTQNLLRYNVTSLPATFIIGRDGDIKKRVDNLDRLSAEVASYMH
ncbi:MAG: AhpC/TSA family protein [Pseudoflavonifractor sp.]|nr:AhpC/TSA family protein [Pseudoflavonifractor sp.]